MLGLPFAEVWLVDTEYVAPDGERPETVCLVAKELTSGRLLRLWADQLGDEPPFRTDDQALFVAYNAAAEFSCFLQLGWPLPTRILDLYAEFRALTNGVTVSGGRGLLSALAYHGIPSITKELKEDMRTRIMAGGPWTSAEKVAILNYCQTDVDCLAPLLERMLLHIRHGRAGLGRALLRGRYMAAVARMVHQGVPIDTALLAQLRAGWGDVKLGLVADVDRDFGVYEGTTFKAGRFRDYLEREHIAWPRLPSGQLQLDGDTFREMGRTHPQIGPLRDLRHAMGELRLERLVVGSDGRNRVGLFPFGARTGRNTPPGTGFIFGPAVWLRGLIKPECGRALAYIDWSCQEVAIAAVLSGDAALLEAVTSGDPYLAFAKRAHLAPVDATKQSHRTVRDRCKIAVLGSNYGMRSRSLAERTGLHELDAANLLHRFERTYARYTAWSRDNIDRAQLVGSAETVLGWPMRVTSATSANSLLNFSMQANGAEMLRLACCLTTEAGVQVCAPVHDALLIEADVADLDDAVHQTRAAMAAASRAVLDGFEIGTDVTVVRWPARYSDDRPGAAAMWAKVTGLIDRVAA